jgi:class 3 adenylate cyclase
MPAGADRRDEEFWRQVLEQGGGLPDRYFTTATKVVFDHEGFIDKFVGDEPVALLFPLLTGERHTARAADRCHFDPHRSGPAELRRRSAARGPGRDIGGSGA